MYFVIVIGLMLVLPLAGIGVEHGSAPLMLLVGKWFVFFGVGWRLAIAGVRQFFQPRFTAEEIFGMTSPEALPLIRELGVANFGAGVVGIASFWAPSFVLPSAIASGLFYAVAGVRHAMEKERGSHENVAMISDLGIALVLAAFVVWRLTN